MGKEETSQRGPIGRQSSFPKRFLEDRRHVGATKTLSGRRWFAMNPDRNWFESGRAHSNSASSSVSAFLKTMSFRQKALTARFAPTPSEGWGIEPRRGHHDVSAPA